MDSDVISQNLQFHRLHDNNQTRVSQNLHPGRSFQKGLVSKCILCKGKWFTPSMFEKFGGKGHHKKWKSSIYYKPSNEGSGLSESVFHHQTAVSPVVDEADQTTDEAAAQLNFSDSPTDATEPAVSPVVEEANQNTDEAAAQLNFSNSPAEWQKPTASEETENMQLIKCLENQFKTINNTLKSIDLSLKKLSINIL
uniref:SAND domain-containing protein n=1 Tax=Cyprinus carpio carpio TaxID=630221 RepID=A0A8C1ELM0_CYPCA